MKKLCVILSVKGTIYCKLYAFVDYLQEFL